jgi:hypothetical protein
MSKVFLDLVIVILMVSAVVTARPMLRRDSRLRELDRFWHARRLTTSWAGHTAVDGPAGED